MSEVTCPGEDHAAAGALQGRCAAVLLGHSAVAVLPATTTDILDEMLLGGGTAASQQGLPTTVGNSCVLRLAKHGIAEVKRTLASCRHPQNACNAQG